MSKFRALLVSTLLATAVVGGATTIDASAADTLNPGASLWCCK